MPKLIHLVPFDKNEQEKFVRAKEFWDNATAYATQAAPYGAERISELDAMADEIQQGMQFQPPEIQEKIVKKLKAKLIDPVEGATAQEFDAAWSQLQQISKQLHKDLMPSMNQMSGLAGPMNGMPPQGPMGIDSATMMAP